MTRTSRRSFLSQAAALPLAAGLGGLLTHAHAASPGDRIKVGQIGVGHAHASGKMSTMRKLTELFDVVGVVEPDEKRRQGAAASPAYRDVTWMTEEQLLNVPGLKAVAVETEVRDLVPTAQRCVEAGMHVHLDKPAGESLSAFRRLLETSQRKDVVVQMGYMFRYNPAFQLLYRAVKEGWLGDVFEVHAVMSKKVNDAARRRLAEYPGGSMFELGCHVIDSLVYILGPPQRVTPYVRRTRPDADRLADNQLAVLEYPRATATVRSTVVEVEGQHRRQFVVCGDAGTIDIRPLEPPKLRLALEQARGEFNKGYQDVELPPPSGRYDGDFLDLAAIIHGRKQPDFTPEHDLAVQAAVLRASGVDDESE
ncbi:MAG: Gfo/Idh/MocA family oxidoreductase [Pirellulaceae bacterium]